MCDLALLLPACPCSQPGYFSTAVMLVGPSMGLFHQLVRAAGSLQQEQGWRFMYGEQDFLNHYFDLVRPPTTG